MKARLALLATMFVAAIVSACGDPTHITASLPITDDTLKVFALSGTPAAFPSAISILARQPVLVDGAAAFDVAIDIDASGNAVIYPPKLVVSTPGGSRRVGLQKVAGAFETVLQAPVTGYDTTAAVVLAPGEVVAMESIHNSAGDACAFAVSPFLYAKLGIDSIDLASRTVTVALAVDPNCGFRSFASGIPKS